MFEVGGRREGANLMKGMWRESGVSREGAEFGDECWLGRIERVLEWNRFVVGSCKVVKRKAEDLRGSAQQVVRMKADGKFVRKAEKPFPTTGSSRKINKINI